LTLCGTAVDSLTLGGSFFVLVNNDLKNDGGLLLLVFKSIVFFRLVVVNNDENLEEVFVCFRVLDEFVLGEFRKKEKYFFDFLVRPGDILGLRSDLVCVRSKSVGVGVVDRL
jgi:hypothetical protein